MQEMNWTQGSGFLLRLVEGAGGGAVVLAGFIKWFGDKWFDQRFRMKVETFKAAHQKELAALKAEQDKELAELRQKHESDLARLTHRLNSRISKVNEKEFEVLREVWSKVNMSHGSTQKVIWGFKYRHILSRLPTHQVDELLSELGLKESQKREILSKSDPERQKTLDQALDFKDIDQAMEHQRLLNNYLIENEIFLPKELGRKFREIWESLQIALTRYETGLECKDHEMQRDAYQLINTVRGKLPELGEAVQERLHSEEA